MDLLLSDDEIQALTTLGNMPEEEGDFIERQAVKVAFVSGITLVDAVVLLMKCGQVLATPEKPWR